MKKIALLLVPALFYADDLKSLLDFALSNNKMVQSRHLTQEAKSKELDSAKSSYFPTLDIGAYHQSKNERTPNLAGDIQSGYAKIGFDIYDGGKKSNTIKQNEALLEEASLNTEYYKKSLQLDVVQDFYTIKSTEATLKALEDKNSVFYHYKNLVALRKEYEIIQNGSFEIVDMANESLYVYRRKYKNQELLVICNFYGKEVAYDIDIEEYSLLNSNYSLTDKNIRPYEARVYIR